MTALLPRRPRGRNAILRTGQYDEMFSGQKHAGAVRCRSSLGLRCLNFGHGLSFREIQIGAKTCSSRIVIISRIA